MSSLGLYILQTILSHVSYCLELNILPEDIGTEKTSHSDTTNKKQPKPGNEFILFLVI